MKWITKLYKKLQIQTHIQEFEPVENYLASRSKSSSKLTFKMLKLYPGNGVLTCKKLSSTWQWIITVLQEGR